MGVIVTEVASVEDHVRVADWPDTTDSGDTLSVTVGTGGGSEELLLLPPLPHALKKSATPTSTAAGNIENFCPIGPPRSVSIRKQYRPNDAPTRSAVSVRSSFAGLSWPKQKLNISLRCQVTGSIGDSGEPGPTNRPLTEILGVTSDT